jgi:phosphohistidine phosphatase
MKTLYLLRHAKAEPGSKVISDPERVLAPRGHEACAIIGAYMRAKAYVPDFVLASPSGRTKETFELVAKAAGIAPMHRFEDALYLATAEDLLRAIHKTDDAIPSLMLVGHNPGMHHISLLLAESRPAPLRKALELKYPTCALAVLWFETRRWKEVSAGRGKLIDFVTPGDL